MNGSGGAGVDHLAAATVPAMPGHECSHGRDPVAGTDNELLVTTREPNHQGD